MGKDLRGKELGIGISQRKDGMYTARISVRGGKRKQAYFKSLQECKRWMIDAQYELEHGDALYSSSPTVDALFKQWIGIKSNTCRAGTVEIYEKIYRCHIQGYIGDMIANDVKPMHCQKLLLEMSNKYQWAYIRECRHVLQAILGYAAENDIIKKNPVTKSITVKSHIPKKEKEALTIPEQRCLLENSADVEYYNAWAFVLQTGIRVGELTALTWKDVNFIERYIDISKTMRWAKGSWEIGEPKTKTSRRRIPLTAEAVQILKNQKQQNVRLRTRPIEFADFVFVNEKGNPIIATVYDFALKRQCKKCGIKEITMHVLRHTFATRCIEAGMQPKTLQIILGHSTLSMTMDLYVHVTDDSKNKAIMAIEDMLKVV